LYTLEQVESGEIGHIQKKYFDTVEQGETLEVFRHGKPVAILMPSGSRGQSRTREVSPLRIPGVSLARAILKEREDSAK
jgi:antitoxin (DNA-binding transcriptional repressor) of toxin-antitoxin stability system